MNGTQRILALAGGVGGGKLARGLAAVVPPANLVIAVNTADDFQHLGLSISPDIDSMLYALADLNDPERGWGLVNETWNFIEAIERLGGESWFRLGDRDLATHVVRTRQLAEGRSLSEVTASLALCLGIAHNVVPMTDDAVRSVVQTDEGPLSFQDYFVRRRCEPRFQGVAFDGAANARPSAGLQTALGNADAIVITPSNPFVSIDPILALPGVSTALSQRRCPVVAVAPIVGGAAVKGPLAKMLAERGLEVSCLEIARLYGNRVDGWIIDSQDRDLAKAIEALGCHVRATGTVMRSLGDKERLARETLSLAHDLTGILR